MLEGLQSESASVRLLVTSWVNFVLSREEDLKALFQPLLRILLIPNAFRQSMRAFEPNPLFIGAGLSADDADKDPAYAKYYYATLGIPDPRDPSDRGQLKENALHYSQLYDARQVLYALSLLQRVVDVDPPAVIGSMSAVLVDPLSYTGVHYRHEAHVSSGEDDTPTSTHPPDDTPISTHPQSDVSLGDTPTPRVPVKDSTQRSLLEITLSSSLCFLQSDYSPDLEAPPPSHRDNLLVKIASTDLVSTLLFQLTGSLGTVRPTQPQDSESGTRGKRKIDNPSFISALTTLCDVQKTILLALGGVVQDMRDNSTSTGCPRGGDDASDGCVRVGLSDGCVRVGLRDGCVRVGLRGDLRTSEGREPDSQPSDPTLALRSFFTHLLLSIQGLVALETQCLCMQENVAMASKMSSLSSGVRAADGGFFPALLPNVPTASQPFYQSLLLDLLSDSTLSPLHETLLNLFLSTLPNMLNQQLHELAPRVIKQLCKNLELSSMQKKKSETVSSDRKQCVLYLYSLCAVVSWCLYGEHQPSLCDGPAPHTSLNPFWRSLHVKDIEEQNETLSPSSRQLSTMSWLFRVFTYSTHTGKALITDDQGCSRIQNSFSSSRVGVASRVGQYTLMLLPAIYNAIVHVWRGCGHSSGSESVERGREFDIGGSRLGQAGVQVGLLSCGSLLATGCITALPVVCAGCVSTHLTTSLYSCRHGGFSFLLFHITHLDGMGEEVCVGM